MTTSGPTSDSDRPVLSYRRPPADVGAEKRDLIKLITISVLSSPGALLRGFALMSVVSGLGVRGMVLAFTCLLLPVAACSAIAVSLLFSSGWRNRRSVRWSILICNSSVVVVGVIGIVIVLWDTFVIHVT